MTRSKRQPLIEYTTESLVKSIAREIGFSVVGISGVRPSPQSDEVFERWIGAGRHGDMRYLPAGGDKRHDPSLLLDDARSVICVAVNYYSREADKRNRRAAEAGEGVVSMYAHGRDYHEVLRGMLDELASALREIFPALRSTACVDTQPVSDRDFALKSGVGWLGKNTCVISPEYGSWIFLGELVTNLDLLSDEPLASLCGSCRRCQDACPTGALDEAFFIDATRCISYLTIERRGEIPEAFHAAIGDNIYGCDRCQEVCPFNRVASDTVVFADDPVSPIVGRSLEELAAIADEEFRELTRGSAIRRARARGLRRNARIALANKRARGDAAA